MVSRNPLVIVGLDAGRSSGSVSTFDFASNVHLFGNDSLGRSRSFLLGEVRRNPDGVEEVSDSGSADEEEDVQEDTKDISLCGGR